jgi:hypothetical protein
MSWLMGGCYVNQATAQCQTARVIVAAAIEYVVDLGQN